MRLFDFLCKACGRTEERFVRSSSPALSCSSCGGALERVFSVPAVVWHTGGRGAGKDTAAPSEAA